MNFKCPKCYTGYDLPDDVLPKSEALASSTRRLKCVRCGSVFVLSTQLASTREALSNSDSVYFEMINPSDVSEDKTQESKPENIKNSPPSHVKHVISSQDVAKDNPEQKVVSAPGQWSSDTTLSLAAYSAADFKQKNKKGPAIALFFVFLILGFFVYVAAFHGWEIEVNRFGSQVKRAFFLETEEEKIEFAIEKLKVNLKEGKPLRLKNGPRVGIVTGDIQNNSLMDIENILLEGRLLNPDKEIVRTVIVPCNKVFSNARIRNMTKNRIRNLYSKAVKEENCTIKSGFPEPFQVVFYDLPKGFNNSYVFQVHIHSAGDEKDPSNRFIEEVSEDEDDE